MVRGGSANSLAPGFRFHPTDEELVRYYLKRKVTNKPFRSDHIAVIDIYKLEPWDLPDKSRLKSRDLEWYFFSSLDKKYGNGSKKNRATDRGYWKTTGKDRPIQVDSRTVALKKTLVYHQGRAPRGERSNWVMHEYRLADEELANAGIAQDVFVLCRVFQKSGTGPKNGEQHGAPFVEEEWDDDEEVAHLPGYNMVAADEITAGDSEYVEINDLEQNLNFGAELENVGVPINLYHGETSNYEERAGNIDENYEKHMVVRHENQFIPDISNDQSTTVLEQPKTDVNSVQEKHVAESSNNANGDFSYLIDEPYFDATNDLPFEANDLWNTSETEFAGDSTGIDMLEEYLSFFDADDDNLSFDPSELMGGDNNVAKHSSPLQKDINGENVEMPMASQIPLVAHYSGGNEPSSSNSKPEEKPSLDSDSGIKHQFLKKASQMLGNISAPPAFASEFPSKDATLRLSSAHPSGSIDFTAGMMRVESILPAANGLDWSVGKNGTIDITLSFSLAQDCASSGTSAPIANLFSGKMGPMVRRSWFSIMFLGVLILSVYKGGTYIYTK